MASTAPTSTASSRLSESPNHGNIISIHIGGGGIRFGSTCWQLYCLEHNIGVGDVTTSSTTTCSPPPPPSTFFSTTSTGTHQARALFLDTDPEALDATQRGSSTNGHSCLYNPDSFVLAKTSASAVFSLCRDAGQKAAPIFMDRIRKAVADSDKLQGFLIYSAVGGGAGSGMLESVLSELEHEYPKTSKVATAIYPGVPSHVTTVEPYNAMLATSALLNYADATLVTDNAALFRVCETNLGCGMRGLGRDTALSWANGALSQLLSGITAPIRFGGPHYNSLAELSSNMVHFKRMSFLTGATTTHTSAGGGGRGPVAAATDLVTRLVEPASALFTTSAPNDNGDFLGPMLACSITYRGELSPKDSQASFNKVAYRQKSPMRFVDWLPGGPRYGIVHEPLRDLCCSTDTKQKHNAAMIVNSAGVLSVFGGLAQEFDMLYSKQAFVHLYEPMEAEEWESAREDVAAMEDDYLAVTTGYDDDDGAGGTADAVLAAGATSVGKVDQARPVTPPVALQQEP